MYSLFQVWFQNTRARERKGQYRAHQQLIHKRCPICRALFRAKSALESHLATKHPQEMAKGNINVDNIPDATDAPGPLHPNQSHSPNNLSQNDLDMQNLLSNPYNMPSHFMPFAGTIGTNPDQLQSNMTRLYEDSLKKYMDELRGANQLSSGTNEPNEENMSSEFVRENGEETPLDLSKPIGGKYDGCNSDGDYKLRIDETQSEPCSDQFDDSIISNPSSPQSSNNSVNNMTPNSNNQMSPSKRFRTQMSSQQIKIMKNIFVDYKTPTMSECDMLGREIGLQKRVVQVWFQNARAKEKKAKLTYANTFCTDVDFTRPPDECKLCSFKYTHKYTIQDHIFTRRHIDNVSKLIQMQSDTPKDYIDKETMNNLLRPREAGGNNVGKSASSDMWNPRGETGSDTSVSSHPHLAQLHAMGLQAMGLQSSGNKPIRLCYNTYN